MLTQMKKTDTKVRKLITSHRIHHSWADKERLYILWEKIGKREIQQELINKLTALGLNKYLDTKTDWM